VGRRWSIDLLKVERLHAGHGIAAEHLHSTQIDGGDWRRLHNEYRRGSRDRQRQERDYAPHRREQPLLGAYHVVLIDTGEPTWTLAHARGTSSLTEPRPVCEAGSPTRCLYRLCTAMRAWRRDRRHRPRGEAQEAGPGVHSHHSRASYYQVLESVCTLYSCTRVARSTVRAGEFSGANTPPRSK
jgi:hypothetical protein